MQESRKVRRRVYKCVWAYITDEPIPEGAMVHPGSNIWQKYDLVSEELVDEGVPIPEKVSLPHR